MSNVHGTCYTYPKRNIQIDCSNPPIIFSQEVIRSINSTFKSPLVEPLEAVGESAFCISTSIPTRKKVANSTELCYRTSR